MTSFETTYWLWALAFAAIAAAAILLPIFRRRRAAMAAAAREGGGGAARFALLAVLATPLLSLAGYWLLAPAVAIEAPVSDLAHGEQDVGKLIESLELKVRESPQEVSGWLILGKSYAMLERWTEARDAYAKAAEVAPENAVAWSGKAEALAILAGRRLQGEPMVLVRKALDLDPLDEKALELAGINAFQEKNYAQAAYYWRQLAKRLPPDLPFTEDILAAAKEAKRLAEEASFDPEREQRPSMKPRKPVPGPRIIGTVELAAGLREQVGPDDPVYLYVRPTTGSGAPVAVLRAKAGQLPLAFEVDDSLAMTPDNRLSQYQEVSVAARVARSGEAAPARGDFEGARLGVKPGDDKVRVVIDQVRP